MTSPGRSQTIRGECTSTVFPVRMATISKERYRILFRQQAEDGEIEYVFGGADGVLVEKRYYEEGRRIWSVSYHEYRRESGKLYPAGIILENHQRRYRLVVRLREIRS